MNPPLQLGSQANAIRAWLLVLLAVVSVSGCVRRRLTVRSNPAGASVYVDKQYIGQTPASTSYLYYGTREIEVAGDGFRTEKVLRRFTPPWYQLPPLDFITETLWPWEIRDERIVDITLVPNQAPDSEVLQARADSFRIQAAQGVTTPLPPTLVDGTDFRNQTVLGDSVPVRPIDPTFQPQLGQPLVNQDAVPGYPGPQFIPPPASPGNQGGFLGNLLTPDGPPQRIPEAGILPGGGYRPEIDSP